jgi:hypothetical protein
LYYFLESAVLKRLQRQVLYPPFVGYFFCELVAIYRTTGRCFRLPVRLSSVGLKEK